MKPGSKLVVVIREDLAPGAQLAQACHAAQKYCFDHHEAAKAWYDASNTIAILACPNEAYLDRLATEAATKGIRLSSFREPDLGDSLTALCLEPSAKTKKLCWHLPLAMRGAE